MFPYREARDLVVAAYTDFSPEIGAIARRFFDENWIDAPIRPNKMAGALARPAARTCIHTCCSTTADGATT